MARAYRASDVDVEVTDNKVFATRESAEKCMAGFRSQALGDEDEYWNVSEDCKDVFQAHTDSEESMAVKMTECDVPFKVEVATLVGISNENILLVTKSWPRECMYDGIREYFLNEFDQRYAEDAEDCYLNVSDREEYADMMAGRLCTKFEAQDANDDEHSYIVTLDEVEL